jgi:mRNA interferase RelE/StbE
MPYQIEVSESALKELSSLPKNVRQRAISAISGLADEPRPHTSKKLKVPGQRYSTRVGRDYRIVYRIDDAEQKVTVLRVRHRKDAYQGL